MRSITLELMRHGTDHNQLLSPNLPYLAVCENAPVTTVHQPFEHEDLLVRLASLSYPGIGSSNHYFEQQRRFQLADVGRAVGQLLADIPGLVSAIGTSKLDVSDADSPTNARAYVNLRLVLTARELAMIPFETAMSSGGLPASSQHLLLQLAMPFSITRESRRAARKFYLSPTNPKVLFAYCDLPGNPVPAEQHALALRKAFDPWLRSNTDSIHHHVHVLRNASLEDIQRACRANRYTHVHLLAHGIVLDQGRENSFMAVALRRDQPLPGEDSIERVTARNLGRALSPMGSDQCLNQPEVVTLATCNSGSGQPVPLSAKGESIAHALHEAGIPLVIASQFPLTFDGSVAMVDSLYSRLLMACDPRIAMIEARKDIARRVPSSHDWASLTCYLSLHPEFDKRNAAAELSRLNAALIPGNLDAMDAAEKLPADADRRYQEAIDTLHRYRPIRSLDAKDEAHRLTMQGGVHRRYGVYLWRQSGDWQPDAAATAQQLVLRDRAVAQLRQSRELYVRAYQLRPSRYWALTEALRISLVIEPGYASPALPLPYGDCWELLCQTARIDLQSPRAQRPWALVDAIEVELLRRAAGKSDTSIDVERLARELLNSVDTTRALAAVRAQIKRFALPPFKGLVNAVELSNVASLLGVEISHAAISDAERKERPNSTRVANRKQ